MKCPKPCWTELEASATGPVCPACGRTGPILTDYCGYIPSAGYRPSAYLDLLRVFRPLDVEKGWAQDVPVDEVAA
jgi:hypothetical protein